MEEKILVSNSLGVVTSKRVTFNLKEGREDISLTQVTSVSYEKRQNILMASLCFLVAVVMLIGVFQMPAVPGSVIVVVLILFILFALLGTAHYIGNYYMRISISGVDRPLMKVEMSKTKEGREIIDAIRAQIFS